MVLLVQQTKVVVVVLERVEIQSLVLLAVRVLL
jgi:hypothetical protein